MQLRLRIILVSFEIHTLQPKSCVKGKVDDEIKVKDDEIRL